jgi:hypothetical protein
METALILYTQADNTPYLVDLYENENISLNYSFNDIKDLTPRGNYSRTFRIPFTETNAKIFGFVQENTFQFSGFNPKRKINASITVDTIPIIEGYVQFKAAYTSNGEVSDLEIVFFGNVVDFFKTIGDADFKNYIGAELQTDYNDILTYDNIATFNGSGYVYLSLTDRGQNWVGEINETGTRSIYSTNESTVPAVGELTPMVSARYIFDKIFSLSGFQFNDTDSATLVEQLDKMWVPWSGEAGYIQTVGNPETAKFKLEGGVDGDTITSGDFSAITLDNGLTFYGAPLSAITEVFDYGNNVTGNEYTAPISARYILQGNCVAEIDTALPTGFQLLFGLVRTYAGQKQLYPYTSPFPFYDVQAGTDELNTPKIASAYSSWSPTTIADNYIPEGAIVEPYILFGSSAILSWGGTITLRNDAGGSFNTLFKSNSITKPYFGNPIDWAANAPIMKCSEFISSIFKMFNLVVIADDINPKLLSFIPIQEYLAQGNTKDWSNKIDLSKDITLTSTADYQSQQNTWTYKPSTDYINSLYNSQGDRVYGRLLLIDPENDFATKEQKTELMFSPTPLALIKGTDYPIPKFINNTGQYVNAGVKILYQCDTTIVINLFNNDAETIVSETFNIFSHYTRAIPSIADEDLNFGQEIPLHPIQSTPWKTLYARYWNDYIADIYAPDARIIEAFFALDFADIYQFKFNDQIFIKDSYWRILEISDYVVGMQDTVKVRLIKMVSATPDCLLHPGPTINVDGSVPFLDSNDDAAAATEACCNKYGYFWVNDDCYAIIRDGKGSGGKEPSILNDTSTPTSDVNNSKNGLIQVNNSVVKEDNDRSIVISDTSYLGANNNGSFVSGNRNYVEDGLGSVTVLGDSAKTINREVTIGSGGTYAGQYQSGIIQLNGFGTWTNSTTAIDLLSNGTLITMPDNSVWYIKLMIVASHADGTGIDFGVTAEFNFNIQNSGGISLKNVTLVDTYSAGISGDMEVDMNISGSTFNPIVYLKNSSYPIPDVNITAQLIYTQYHYE